METAKRTFYKLIVSDQILVGGEGFLRTENIVLSGINKCRITSVTCWGLCTTDNDNLIITCSVYGALNMPNWVGSADKEQYARNNGGLFFDDKKMTECYIDVPAGFAIPISAMVKLASIAAEVMNVSVVVVVNYEETIFS